MSTELTKNINDLFKQASSIDFYRKFQTLLIQFVKPTYEDINLINKDGMVENVNEERIKTFRVLNTVFNTLSCKTFIPDSFFTKVEHKQDEIIDFWSSVSRKVESRKVIGFPLCVFSNKTYKSLLKNDEAFYLHFLKTPENRLSPLYKRINEEQEFVSEMFQKILIYYELYKNNLVSDNYIFDEIKNAVPLKTSFKIFDCVFTFDIKTILILSPLTPLYISKNVTPSVYFNSLDTLETESLACKNCTNFPEFLLNNFIDYFSKNLYYSRNISSMADVSPIVNYLSSGSLYLAHKKTSRNFFFTLVLNTIETHISFLFIFDSPTPSSYMLTSQTLSLKEVNEDFIFYKPNFIFEKVQRNYMITN